MDFAFDNPTFPAMLPLKRQGRAVKIKCGKGL
jgi:hypothetical protein